METWIVDIFKFIGGGAVTLVGVWAVFRVQNKAARTEAAFGVSDRWQGWALQLEKRVKDAETKAESAETKVAELKVDVARYRAENGSIRAVLDEALDWIEWALERLAALGVSHRPLPRAVARLLRQRPAEKGE